MEEVFLRRVPMLRSVSHFMRGRFRHNLTVTLQGRCRAKLVGDRFGEKRAWKAFGLAPAMLLHKPKTGGQYRSSCVVGAGQQIREGSMGRFVGRTCSNRIGVIRSKDSTQDAEQKSRGEAACNRVQQGQVSRARQALTGATLAPGTWKTLAELQRRRPQEQVREIPPEVMAGNPTPVVLDPVAFSQCLSSAPSGSSPGPGGCTYEMLKVCVDDRETLHLLLRAAEDLARAKAPETVTRAFTMSTMTALQKKDGGVRGIATGTSFRRLVARTLARQFGKEVEAVCAPFQFALSTRAGTDCVGHVIRVLTDADTECTILSIDGVGAYDLVFRDSFLTKLHQVPRLRGLLPFVRSLYAQPTTYMWTDDTGAQHRIRQAEGEEQGNPLMPLLFSLGIHESLCAVSERLNWKTKCSLFWTTFTWPRHQTGPVARTICWDNNCWPGSGSNSIQKKPGNGIAAERVPLMWSIWARKSGTQRASKSWALQLGRQSSCTVPSSKS